MAFGWDGAVCLIFKHTCHGKRAMVNKTFLRDLKILLEKITSLVEGEIADEDNRAEEIDELVERGTADEDNVARNESELVERGFVDDVGEKSKSIDDLRDMGMRSGSTKRKLIQDDDKIRKFVDGIEFKARARAELAGMLHREIYILGMVMGREYREDYNNMKDMYLNFEKICGKLMKLGHSWELFYPDFMRGVGDNEDGLIKTEAFSFISTVTQEMTDGKSCENVGKEYNMQYADLKKYCYETFNIPYFEFEERMKEYIRRQMDGNGAYSYGDFSRGLHAFEYPNTSTSDTGYYDGYGGGDDAWPAQLHQEPDDSPY
jgi:hypothetical protein